MTMKKIFFLLMGVAAAPQETKVENDARFHSLLLTAARSHEAFGKIDDVLRFAPTLCMAPPPAPVRWSFSKDESTHGQKLYFLYAWDAAAYLTEKRADHRKKDHLAPVYEKKPAEQALIKQSWTVVDAKLPAAGEDKSCFITKDGKLFRTGERKDLFVMVKLEAQTEGTDPGWVYGTVTPDFKSVTSSGRVASCMACHEKAGDGRLFGFTKPAPK